MPEKAFEIYEEDFTKTVMDYIMYENKINVKEFTDNLIEKVTYSSDIKMKGNDSVINIKGGDKKNEQN